MLPTNTLLKAALVASFITPPILEPLADMGLGAVSAVAQVPTQVDWISPYTHEDDVSESGTYYNWAWNPLWEYPPGSGTYWARWVPTPMDPQPVQGEQEREDSGEDWHYGHCNAYELGTPIGYYTAGYASWPNCYWKGEGCSDTFGWGLTERPGNSEASFAPRSDELELPNHRKGDTRGTVARFDLNGQMVWYRHLFTGQIWNVIQASDGNPVIAGQATMNKWPDNEPGDNTTIRFNAEPGVDMNTIDCQIFQTAIRNFGYVAKLDANDGHIIWCTMVVGDEQFPESLERASLFQDLVEVTGPDGQEYWAVGHSTDAITNGWPPRPMIARLKEDGTYINSLVCHEGDQQLPANWPATDGYAQFTSIATNPATSMVVASGWYNAPSGRQAFLAYMGGVGNGDLIPNWVRDTGNPNDQTVGQGGHLTNLPNSTSGAGFVSAGATGIIWPVMANFSIGAGYSGRNAANLFVHGLDLNGDLQWTTDLGETRAYDLQSDIAATADGRIAVVASVPGQPEGVIGYNDLPGATQTCLMNDLGYDPAGSAGAVNWQTVDLFDYWNTDAYLAKLDPATGTVVWETSWDADATSTFECSPGDLRNQECVYKVTEADDGGLVVSGNTSHNFDDYYLVKVQPPCQSTVAFADIPLNDQGAHVLAANATWTSDMDIYGAVVVPEDITLTISGCTIRFADSQQLYWPTRIIVEGGGTLIVNDAKLTSLDQCPNSLWDGIQLRGQELASQLPYPGIGLLQGYLNAKNSTISNARTGIAVTDGDFLAPLPPKPGSGGIVSATDCIFLNNVYDVAFSPYENHTTADPQSILPNASGFVRCAFRTDGGVPAEGAYPVDHVVMTKVRGIPFAGCTWSNTLLGPQLELATQQGTGIHAVNSSFTVADHCASLLPQGVPCPLNDLSTSRFGNLHRGVVATTFDPSRTFTVDHAAFFRCNGGIRMEGVQDAGITRNTFDIAEPFVPGLLGPTYGVYGDQSTGYSIQENSFTTSQPSGVKKVGLIIKDSGKHYNTFYNNTFDNLYTGSIIEGVNAGEDDALGLEVKCNDYGLADDNFFDNALTGGHVRVQKTQGAPISSPLDQTEWKNPAGNRFSVDHTGVGDPEEDWHVQVTATVVEYFHHSPIIGSRTQPVYSNLPNEITPNDQFVTWPEKPIACPSLLDDGGKEVKRLVAEGEHGEYESSKDVYDSTKDNGDTYSLLGYVSDPTKSSTQVRNALQSVAPKVSLEVWQAAFERSPPMSAWNITQALLSNSPLQAEAVLMMDAYGLPHGYASLVHAAQNGLNVLTLMESAIAEHGGNEAEALADLGRMSWLDEEDLAASLDALLELHQELPAENHALTVSGVLTAKGDYSALESLALVEENTSDSPERYTLLKHYAQLEQQEGWAEPDEALRTWLANLGQQRDVQGSTWANAWLHALGEELPEEVIVLPETGPKSAGRTQQGQPVQWQEENLLEVFPNPARNVAYVAFDFGRNDQALLRILDLHGRQLGSQVLRGTEGIATITLDGLGSGLYLVEVVRTDAPSQQARLVVQ